MSSSTATIMEPIEVLLLIAAASLLCLAAHDRNHQNETTIDRSARVGQNAEADIIDRGTLDKGGGKNDSSPLILEDCSPGTWRKIERRGELFHDAQLWERLIERS